MKKIVLSLLGVFFLCAVAGAQTVRNVTAEFGKDAMRPAYSMPFDCSRKIVEEALQKRLKKDKIKGKSFSGMMLYSKVNNSQLGVQNCNLYTKVESVGKKSNLYFFIERENGNFVTTGDAEESSVMKYMESLTADVAALQQKYDVNSQKKVYEKAEKEYQKLISQQKKLDKKIQKADAERQEQKTILEELQKQ